MFIKYGSISYYTMRKNREEYSLLLISVSSVVYTYWSDLDRNTEVIVTQSLLSCIKGSSEEHQFHSI